MRIALIGEYSNVHATLAEGLRRLGHEVVVASDGDGWKQYPRDIDLSRSRTNKIGGLLYAVKAWQRLSKLRDFDVVQLINPVFLRLKAEQLLPYYRLLRRRNRNIVLCAMGVDAYYIQACLDGTLRRSDLSYHGHIRPIKEVEIWRRDWLNGAKGKLNEQIACDCDAIVAGLPEYYIVYSREFKEKLSYIPLPMTPVAHPTDKKQDGRMRFFIGIQSHRDEFKGTDVMLAALERLAAEMPERVEILKVESVPFAEYQRMIDQSDVVLDQLYGYGPAMNSLLAMSRGKVVVTGLEPETYAMLNERELQPVQGVEPTEEGVLSVLRALAINPAQVKQLGEESRAYVLRHHSTDAVARQYETLYKQLQKAN